MALMEYMQLYERNVQGVCLLSLLLGKPRQEDCSLVSSLGTYGVGTQAGTSNNKDDNPGQ